MMRTSSSWVLLLVASSFLMTTPTHAFFQKKYNPVIFFKVPPGIIPECDEMEKCIRQVEKELQVKVDRMDVARNENAAALLSLLRGSNNPPLLYHRESRQMVSSAERGRIRALIKGRFLVPSSSERKGKKGKADALLVADQEAALEQEDLILMEDQMLTPLQRKGKQSIRERTQEKGRVQD
jgi:hypothetical protein